MYNTQRMFHILTLLAELYTMIKSLHTFNLSMFVHQIQ
jgi:hypothetical protein